jgi:hypothetical protein
MIGKPEWFSPRKFGWGLGLRTKESVLYGIGIAAVIFTISLLPLSVDARMALIGVILAIVVADITHIMVFVYSKLDEREQRHQAFAERSAAFAAVACIFAYMGYMAFTSGQDEAAITEKIVFPVGMLLAMAIAKGGTLLYLERRG